MQPVEAIPREQWSAEADPPTAEHPAVWAGRLAYREQPPRRLPAPSPPPARTVLAALRACRPAGWLKNFLVLLAPAAAGALTRSGASTSAWFAAIAFCLLSSAVALAGDPRELERKQALRLAAALAAVGLLTATAVRPALGALALCYLAVALTYPSWSERVPYAGVAALAIGLAVRAAGGDLAAGAPIQIPFVLLVGAIALVASAIRHRAKRGGRTTRRRTSRVRFRRILALALALLVGDAFISFAAAMNAPSNTPFGVRAVEWLRGNGAAWLVSDVENVFYTWSAPATGGPALKRLPKVGSAHVQATLGYRPSAIPPVIHPALAGEGAWRGTGPVVRGAPPVLVTTFRPDPNYPQLVAGVAWIDASRTRLELYPGRYEPPGGGTALAEIPPQLRGGLLAAFNSGFRLEDTGAGFVAAGHVYAPLKDGQATLIGYRNGTVDVQTWRGASTPGPNVEFARQNLPLIIEGGHLNPALSNDALWGATVANAVRVWRSGIGVDAHGNLIYAAADIQTAQSLAQILQRAGAVRAMELDINYDWTTFNFFGAWGAVNPQKLLPGMSRPATRYLTPDDRDFFAVYAR